MSKINVLVLSNGELKEKEIDNDLKSLQKEVDGYIEIPFICEKFMENNIDVIINEEGKINRLNKELAIVKDDKIIDVICGNCIFTSTDDEGNTIGLSDKQMDIVRDKLNCDIICQYGFIKMIEV